ncbi:hypothetical protein CAL29_16570 [Bordetella genomosp. 10]|uniref:Alpha/beta hydrolase fold-3 domain-containing protein n=1 Tax=Bordetella genomosp. 10 TaxID=1416804 RepID=A0A261RZN6_9BORD|nr:hypothetical protein CAL29_16570 [Bordetella genomosp. 10]
MQVLRRAAALESASHRWELPEAQRRRQASEQAAALLPKLAHRGLTRTDVYAVAAGREIPVRLYRPAAAAGRRAALMPYAHGGGWVVGSIATHDTLCAELAVRTGYVVASVHYRRAPEHRHPAQHDDLWDAVAWLLRHAAALGLDGDAPMALGGDSAGAHLALGCAYRALREAPGRYDRLLLFYPALDPAMSSGSARRHAEGPGLTRAAMRYYWEALLGGAAPRRSQRLALPLTWPRRGPALPATVLVTAETDMLRDEGEDYARRLQAAGVRVAHWRAPGMVHGFARMLAASPAARRQVRRACRALLDIA